MSSRPFPPDIGAPNMRAKLPEKVVNIEIAEQTEMLINLAAHMPRIASTLFSLVGQAACCLCLLGCVNPLNAGHYQRYMDAGLRAENRGDYITARRHFIRARSNSVQGFLGKEAESAAIYNIGCMNGMLGYF